MKLRKVGILKQLIIKKRSKNCKLNINSVYKIKIYEI